MENNTPPSKLDETIKEHLSNYDANYDAGDWSRMERMLDSAPKSIAPSGSYNKAFIIGAAVLVGGFLIFKVVGSSTKTAETPAETTTIVPSENKTEVVTSPAPVVVKTAPVAIPENKTLDVPVAKTVVPEVKTPGNTVVVANTKDKATDKNKKEKEDKLKDLKLDPESLKNQKVSVMGKEPIFGDQIDSSKGIVRETKEKESTKKQAVSKGGNTVGLGALFLNADSIKKQQELMKKDTLHN